ncbi:AraC family transcriptional regulator [Pseudofrankia sp. EUN1h]|nr:AraC family transcriptional regulator [Pseudofrankia sp. EUN1h]
MYRERRAGALAATMWLATAPAPRGETGEAAATSPQAAEHRVLPDGCMDLIWSRAGPGDLGQVIVAGPDTAPAVGLWRPGSRHLGVRFDSGVGPAYIGVPASEVRDRRVPLAEIWGLAAAARLAERLAAAEAPAAAFEAEIASRGRLDGLADLLPPVALAGIRAGAPVAQAARAAALSERQLLRRCQLAVGYGPKTLARIVRFRRALALARAGSPFADVAAAAGYADQAHLAREVRALGGAPLRELVTPAIASAGAS